VAAISSVVISGGLDGTLLFHDIETKSNIVSIENAHPKGVTAITVFSLHDDEDLFAGSPPACASALCRLTRCQSQRERTRRASFGLTAAFS
jgi:hypothetical protein